MLISETRPCSDCAQYKRPLTGFPICKKKLMGVTTDMLVTYKVEEGTCFELALAPPSDSIPLTK